MTLNKERDQDYDNGFLESLRLQHYDTNIPEVTQTLVNIEASGRLGHKTLRSLLKRSSLW